MNTIKHIIPFLLALTFGAAQAATAPLLGQAQDFAVLGASTITNTGATTIVGDVGLSPGSAITGAGSFSLIGSVHERDTAASDAHNAGIKAFTAFANKTPTIDLTGQNLSAMTLNAGVYHFDSSAQLTGTLTLDVQNDPNAIFIFQIGSSLTTATDSTVNVINGGSQTGIFWQVGSSATLGVNTAFAGNILASQSITLDTGANIFGGRALALNGAVTMDHNGLYSSCGSTCNDFGSAGYSGVSAVPEPSAPLMFGFGLLLLAAPKIRSRLSARAKSTRDLT
jgi:hypothetical protein